MFPSSTAHRSILPHFRGKLKRETWRWLDRDEEDTSDDGSLAC
jgi:hypothetical protein